MDRDAKLLHFDAGFQDLMGEVSGARRKAVTVGIETETAGWELKFHSHQKMQLMLSAHVAAAREGVACHRGSGPGGVLRATASSGRLGASDFTHMEELGVTIQGRVFRT